MPKQYYIVARPKNGGSSPRYYWCSPTQGEDMVPFGYEDAYKFKSVKEAEDKIEQLKPQWKGLDFRVGSKL